MENARPQLSRFNHVSIPVRDLAEAKRFYIDVLGGEIVNDRLPTFGEVRVGGAIIGFSTERGEVPPARHEFPHIAFETSSDDFMPMRAWLAENGVKLGPAWTRNHVAALTYFKDPSGNLIELYCPNFAGAKELLRADTGDEVVDFTTLDYAWRPAVSAPSRSDR
jgi:catechol 2,3-dioxygenase-like lactoylglutathione lyase family enzyme